MSIEHNTNKKKLKRLKIDSMNNKTISESVKPFVLVNLKIGLFGNDVENTYCNRLDYGTLDMVIRPIVDMVQFFRCHLDTRILPLLKYRLARIVEINVRMADVSYK